MLRPLRIAAVSALIIVGVQLTVWVVGCNNWNANGFFINVSTLHVRTCLIIGADVNVRDERGRTPLHNSAALNSWGTAQAGNIEVLIANGADITVKDVDGLVPLQLTIWSNFQNSAVIEALTFPDVDIEARKNGLTALLRAADYSRAEVIKALLAAGADMNARVDYSDSRFQSHMPGFTLLHVAARNPSPGGPGVVDLLIREGMDVNARDEQGDTPLHAAVSTDWKRPGGVDVLMALINAGADISARNQNGELPVDRADSYFSGNLLSGLRDKDSPAGIVYQFLAAARLE